MSASKNTTVANMKRNDVSKATKSAIPAQFSKAQAQPLQRASKAAGSDGRIIGRTI